MNAKSIDGLRRRDSSNRLGFAEKRTKKTAAISPDLGSLVAPERRQVAARDDQAKADEHDEAIRDFLSSVQDDDPTNLVSELPEKNAKTKRKKPKKVKKPKMKRALKITAWTLGVLLVLAAGVATWAYIQGNDLVSRVTGGSLLNMLMADPDTPLAEDPASGRTNILIFGTEGYSMDDSNHPGAQLTDSMMVASLDQDSGDIRTISLPRDLKARTCTSTAKLNEVYYCTYHKNAKTKESRDEYEHLAARALADQAEEILGVKIQYFVHVNWQALVQIVDALGGIDVAFVYKGEGWDGSEVAIETLDKRGLRDYWNARTQTWGIDYKNGGVAHLNGEQALGVARSRNESGGYGSGSNFGREQFQQKIIQAVIMKAKQTNLAADFLGVLGIKDAVGDNLRMDFKDTELKSLFKLAGRVDMGGMKTVSLQDTDEGAALLISGMLSVPGVNGLECGGSVPGCLSYVYPRAGAGNYVAVHDYVARKLSSDPAVSESAKIVVMNATSAAGVAASEGTRLKEKKYNVVQNANAPSALGAVDGVKIYQMNKQMPGTAKGLGEMYGVEILTSIPESLTSYAVDFIIVLGNGYAS